MHRSTTNSASPRFREAIDNALDLLHNDAEPPASTAKELAHPLPSLLEQCQQLLTEADVQNPPPVRTVHSLACTGGTLISRCIAAQPNTQVLSEVDPLSPFVPGGFLPTDIIGLSRFSSRPADRETQILLFLAGLQALYDQSLRAGQHLILRDHSHGHFHFSDTIPDRPTLRDIVQRTHPVRSLVTVRHPFDVYLSLLDTGWVQHFSPPTLNEYAQRVHAFLDAYPDCPLIRYEDFVAEPTTVMPSICEALALSYNPDFTDTFAVIELSGNTGRSGDLISPRPRRPHPPSLDQEAQASDAYQTLLARLGYPA
ncbi:sulfotransferase family protein [Rhabdochromatium marinum]|uniref:sulfotransferase family protein n=1 Tax=Rhabdochromatium marinum TaxID=48729 RepID=UPI00190648DB|nr:sulfotransferase family protein [Rhabdochromatium marinum]MBK1649514.1 sulfotransferase family protein [Rhabdochromatium marinum]